MVEPELFGQYRLDELIGRGGMGEVWQAFDTVRGRAVALKRLPRQLAIHPGFQTRFRRESALVARLAEPHIIPIHDFGEIDGCLFIDMRLVEGTDLATVLATRGPLTPAQAVRVIACAASALDAAHAKGLIHRDVKPSNLLVVGRDNPDFVYLTDFGIAHALDDSADRTHTRGAVGTLAYMAPERFGDNPVDQRVDVYSLACVLYECLTGARPFTAAEPIGFINAHANGAIPKPSQHRADVPTAMDEVIARGMAKDPSQRYRGAGELAAAAKKALEVSAQHPNPPITDQTPTSPADPDKPPSLTRRRLAVVAALTVVALLTAGLWTLIHNRPDSPTLDAMRQRGYAVIGVKDDQPDLGVKDPVTGQYSGFDIEIAKLIAVKLGFPEDKIHYQTVRSDAREDAITHGTVDYYVGTYTITESRKQQVRFAGPYLLAGQAILVRKNDSTINGKESLRGKKVCSARGSTTIKRLQQEGLTEPNNVVEVETYSECVAQLINKKVEAVTTDDVILEGYVLQQPDKLKLVSFAFSTEPYGIGLAKNDAALCGKIDDILQAAFQDGTWQLIYNATLGKSGASADPPRLQHC
ncbi:MAG: transporter substrate-binding domain-containing protein [Pseudonocardia sp.]|nr:transporter substrate-binding domain-containing protein [Pseudonocardia sp.]